MSMARKLFIQWNIFEWLNPVNEMILEEFPYSSIIADGIEALVA